MQLGELIEKEPPPRPGEGPPPVTALDRRILDALAESDLCRTGEISIAVEELPYRVSARLRLMADRGLVLKIPVPDGPRRGPGAFTYRLPADASATAVTAS